MTGGEGMLFSSGCGEAAAGVACACAYLHHGSSIAEVRANSSISAMRSRYYPFLEERAMLGVIDAAVVGAGVACACAYLPIMAHHGASRRIMAHHGASWRITAHHGASWRIMAHHGTPWRITAHHGASRRIMAHHRASWRIMARIAPSIWGNISNILRYLHGRTHM